VSIHLTILLLLTAPLYGIVLHPDSTVPPDTPHPPFTVVGRWSSNASCVAIAPNYILTTRHQGGGVGTRVYFNGTAYTVAQVWNAAEVVPNRLTDIRVCRIVEPSGGKNYPANLIEYAGIYPEPNEMTQTVWLGGYGKTRGADLINDANAIYGYSWTGTANTVRLWGTNQIYAVYSGMAYGLYYAPIVVASFNGATSSLMEAAVAEWDSGGGWLLWHNNEWQVAGLSCTVSDAGFSKFEYFPSVAYAVRVSAFASWIKSVSSFVRPDLNYDGVVNLSDLILFTRGWRTRETDAAFNPLLDFNGDGKINFVDYNWMLDCWSY
jgi:hypothetical protein